MVRNSFRGEGNNLINRIKTFPLEVSIIISYIIISTIQYFFNFYEHFFNIIQPAILALIFFSLSSTCYRKRNKIRQLFYNKMGKKEYYNNRIFRYSILFLVFGFIFLLLTIASFFKYY